LLEELTSLFSEDERSIAPGADFSANDEPAETTLPKIAVAQLLQGAERQRASDI